MPEAPELFREIKRALDMVDAERRSTFAQDARVRGLEVAKLSLQLALGVYDRWSRELLETGVGV